MSQGTSETRVMDLLTTMTAASIEASNLDARSLMLVRIAALVAMDAPPASYLLNLAAAQEAEVDVEQVRDVFLAIAPIVGTARVASAAGEDRARPRARRARDRARAQGGRREPDM